MSDYLMEALAKLDDDSSKVVHLSPGQRRALRDYLAQHGISGRFVRDSAVMRRTSGRPGRDAVQVWPVREMGNE